MKHVAAVLLLALGGKEINEANINATLSSVGIKPNATAVKLVLEACKGKTPDQLIALGLPKLSAAVASVATSAVEAPAKDKKDDKKKDAPKKEEKKPVVVEEEEDAGGFGDLFG